MGKRRGAYRVLLGKPEGKRPLGRRRPRWEDNIQMSLQKIGWVLDWIHLAKDKGQVSASCKQVNKLSRYIEFGQFLD
jgi:hypothetical protein